MMCNKPLLFEERKQSSQRGQPNIVIIEQSGCPMLSSIPQVSRKIWLLIRGHRWVERGMDVPNQQHAIGACEETGSMLLWMDMSGSTAGARPTDSFSCHQSAAS
jgi:hypothetical protein